MIFLTTIWGHLETACLCTGSIQVGSRKGQGSRIHMNWLWEPSPPSPMTPMLRSTPSQQTYAISMTMCALGCTSFTAQLHRCRSRFLKATDQSLHRWGDRLLLPAKSGNHPLLASNLRSLNLQIRHGGAMYSGPEKIRMIAPGSWRRRTFGSLPRMLPGNGTAASAQSAFA